MLKLKVIEITQPFGTFYATKMNSDQLIKIAEAEPYRILDNGEYAGSQRPRNDKRLAEIAQYLKGVESALPNSIIISGNTKSNKNEDIWRIVRENNETYLIIPKLEINGAIIDGQHRINGFKLLNESERKNYELLCSVYLDIPNPYQAYLFATINMNQKRVDKSLAYELYGYNLDEENSEQWSSEKLAVFITRKLNLDENSIFKNHIIVAAQNDDALFEVSPKNQEWFISTASIVDGILTLISVNPKKDRDKLQQMLFNERKRIKLNSDSTPLRNYYLESNDKLIYLIVLNYFNASYKLLYKKNSYIFKTIGIQSQFNLLKNILINYLDTDKDISVEYFKSLLKPCELIDFSDNFYTASGLGKTRINNSLLLKLGFKKLEEIHKLEEIEDYRRLLNL
jgi:DNA phosphorothioation-associated DGQHR protein 1